MNVPMVELFALCLIATGISGCAHSYIDEQGNRRIIGLVNLAISPATSEPAAADWIRLRQIGISLNRSEFASSLDVGYSDNTIAVIRNNSCAFIKGEDYASHPSR